MNYSMNYNPYNYSYNQYGVGQTDPTLSRLQQLENIQKQYQQPQGAVQNVNWIPVAGLDGAKNQIVQPGQTTWMMSNNEQVFFVKSVDGMGSATLRAFRFQEIPLDELSNPQTNMGTPGNDYVTREEFNALLAKLGEPVNGQIKGEMNS